MSTPRQQLIGFYILLGIAGVLVLAMWFPFLKLVALSAILAILFYPLQRRMVREVKRPGVAAFLTLLFILLIVFLPLALLGNMVFNELHSLYTQFRNGGNSFNSSSFLQGLPESMRSIADRILSDAGQKISSITSNAFQIVSGLLANVASFLASFFLVIISLYYFLKDGDKIRDYLSGIFPLSLEHESRIITKLEMAISGVVKGTFLVALAQGVVAVIGFYIFKVPQPLLWGMVTLLAAFVPTLGTSLALIPAVIYVFISGHTGAAIGLAIWGAAAVGLIDNVLSPNLIGSRTRLHPILVLFSVIGGIAMFGFIGFLLGPIFMAVFVALLDIYQTDLK